jgi:hypothetical protein
MNSRMTAAAVIALALVVGAAAGAWYELRGRPPEFCEISGRSIHSNMLTVVKVEGKTLHACCPRCPLTLAEQTHKKVELMEVTDYPSGRSLRAADAYFVNGSPVEMCSAPRMESDESRTPYMRTFDRCSPSVVAFAREDQARQFISQHGGKLERLQELVQESAAGQAPAGESSHD